MKKRRKEKWMLFIGICICILTCSGCRNDANVKVDGYQYLVGVSLTNVMEPWLNNLVNMLSARAEEEKSINLIFRDAAGSTEKQIQDIQALMECGIDLLMVVPDGSNDLNDIMESVYKEIPIVAVGVEPDTDAYTAVIQADDEKIGELAGEHILNVLYEDGDKVLVIQGMEDSPISDKRLAGFQKAVTGKIPEEDISYCYGEWLRDVAELRTKDYLVINGSADIVFAFNDEMAYGAYSACQQFRVMGKTEFIGVDGFDGESAGVNMVENSILNATVQSPDFASLVYEKTKAVLKGEEVEKNIVIVPQIIVGNKKS